MKRMYLASVAALLLTAPVGFPVAAQDNGDAMGTMGQAAMRAAASMFTDSEEQSIKDFYKQRAEEVLRGQMNRTAGADDDDDDDRDDDEDDDDNDRDGQKADRDKGKTKGSAMSRGRGRGGQGRGGQGRGGRPDLPPGIAKNLERGKPLPPGIARNYLPDGLEGELPVREGQSRVLVDNDVVLVDDTTNVVIDVIEDVLGGLSQ